MGWLFVQLGLGKGNSVLPRLRTRRTGNSHTSLGQQLSSGTVMHSTPSFKKLEVDPEAKDKCYLVVALLGINERADDGRKNSNSLFQGSTRRRPCVE
jgi:hypothetical protein